MAKKEFSNYYNKKGRREGQEGDEGRKEGRIRIKGQEGDEGRKGG